MCAEAVAAMLPFLADEYGNPSGSHSLARAALRALDEAREEMASLLGASASQLIFTSGGTEADNLAILGVVAGASARDAGAGVLCSAVEHPAVLESCRAAGGRTLAVDDLGVVDLEALAEALDESVGIVSVMLVNNETGVRQPLEAVVALVHEQSPRALVHSDAVQAFAWLDVARLTAGADLISVSAHKFGGPKGVGALVVRHGARVRPRIDGGGQERGRRSGTPNVAGAVGAAAALAATVAGRDDDVARVRALRDRLGDGLVARVSGAVESGDRDRRVAGILHVRVPGVESEAAVVLLDEAGVAASAGAACSSGAVEPSHVLTAMGLGAAEASSGLRFSLGVTTTDEDVDHALAQVPGVLDALRN